MQTADDYAESAISEALNNLQTLADFDLDDLTQEARDNANPNVIYYSDAEEVIDCYESEYYRDAEDLCGGQTYTASEWRKAQMAYANALIYCATGAAIYEQAQAIEEKINPFRDEVESLGGNPDEAKFETDCAFGWEVHNYETWEGIMIWGARNPHRTFNCNPHKLEGELYAASFKVADGVWLNLAWKPEPEENEAQDKTL